MLGNHFNRHGKASARSCSRGVLRKQPVGEAAGGETSAGGCSCTNTGSKAVAELTKLPFQNAVGGTSGSSKNQQRYLADSGLSSYPFLRVLNTQNDAFLGKFHHSSTKQNVSQDMEPAVSELTA